MRHGMYDNLAEKAFANLLCRNYIMFPINGQMTTLLHMAKSLIVNLQLDRPPGAINRRLLFMKGYVAAQVSQAAKDASPRTLDEQRGLLGCYYLTSVKSVLASTRANCC